MSEDMKLHRHSDTAVVLGATHEKGTFKGQPYQHQGRFTDTWIKKDGQWICIASQLSLIGKEELLVTQDRHGSCVEPLFGQNKETGLNYEAG